LDIAGGASRFMRDQIPQAVGEMFFGQQAAAT
jgi:hypothetical protein